MRQDETMESGPIEAFYSREIAALELYSNGATSLIYKAFRDNRYVLIKQLKPEYASKAFYQDSLRKECHTGIKLKSPYLPHYEATDEDVVANGLTIEYIQGKTLEEILASDPQYLADPKRMILLLQQLLEGLSHLHAQRVVHLDIKPSNLIVDQINGHLHIIDLGFCYTDDMPFTTGMTNAFAAPEQQAGQKVDARTDLYAVGKLLLHIQERTKQKLPKPLPRLMRRCLKPLPEERYQSAQEALEDMNRSSRRGIWLSLLVLVSIAAVGLYTLKDTLLPEAKLPYDFCVKNVLNTQPIYYHILSEDSAWVEITYKQKTGNDYYTDLSILPTVTYDGKEYTIVAIGDSAFNHCKQLTGVSLPETIREIGARAFNDCPKLHTVTLPNQIRSIGTFAFGSCKKITRINIPDSLDVIQEGCFFDTNIHEVTIPEGVVSIKRDAFCGCNELMKVRLPESLVSLDRGVFYHCEKLARITLPANLNSIGEYCFDECAALTEVHCQSVLPPKATTIFPDSCSAIIYVPQGSLESYQNAECWDSCDLREE